MAAKNGHCAPDPHLMISLVKPPNNFHPTEIGSECFSCLIFSYVFSHRFHPKTDNGIPSHTLSLCPSQHYFRV